MDGQVSFIFHLSLLFLICSFFRPDELHGFVFELFPSTLQVANDLSPYNQIIGQKCLNAFLKDSIACEALKVNHYDDLVFTKLSNLLHEYDQTTFEPIMKNLMILLKKSLVPRTVQRSDSKPVERADTTKLDQIMEAMLETLALKREDHVLAELYLTILNEQILPLAKAHLLKFGKKFINTMSTLIDDLVIKEDWIPLIFLVFKALKNFLVLIDYQINEDSTSLLLMHLARLLIRVDFDRLPDDERRQFYSQVLDIFLGIEQKGNQKCRDYVKLFCSQTSDFNYLWTNIGSLDPVLDDFVRRNLAPDVS